MTSLLRRTNFFGGSLLSSGAAFLLSSSAFAASGQDTATSSFSSGSALNQAPSAMQSRIPSMIPAAPAGAQHPATMSTTGFPAVAPNAAAAGNSLVPATPISKASVSNDQESLLLGVLQNINPAGWVAAPVRIFAANVASPSAHTAAAGETIVSMEQLGLELDSQKVTILQEFGCSEVFERGFQRGQRRIIARVFTFNTVNGAYGAYMLMRQGAGNVIVRGDASSEDQDSISFWQGRTLVTISGPQDDEESKTLVTNMADKLAAISREHGQLPDVLERMPKLGRVHGSERVVMGPVSARRFITAPYLNSLNFSRAICCGVADYQVQEPPDRLKVMNLEFATPQEAMLAFNSYGLNFGGRQIQIAAPFGGMSSLYKTNKTYLLFQQKGRQFTIITHARRAESAEYLARFM
jgi:hypothetical protein